MSKRKRLSNSDSSQHEASGVAALGNTATFAYKMSKQNDKFLLSKWKLQDVAAEVLGDDWGTASCLRSQLGNQTCVHVGEGGKAHYSGLKTCSSVWVCPICSVKISTRRRDEIQAALASANGSELIPVLVTYTLQHSLNDKLEKLINDLKDAQRYMLNGRYRKEFYSRFDVAGYIRSVETRWSSKTGWHPHIHELLLVKSEQSTDEIKAFLMGRYGDRLESKGYLVNNHTIDVRGGDINAQETVSDYLTKSTIELELTSGNWKNGASISPFQLLSAYHETDNQKFAVLFREYAEATRGKKWITWSRGLRDLLLEDEEETDEEIAEKVEEGEIVVILDRKEWGRVCGRRLRGELLLHARLGDAAEWLASIGVRSP
jgi:hypothetical protein